MARRAAPEPPQSDPAAADRASGQAARPEAAGAALPDGEAGAPQPAPGRRASRSKRRIGWGGRFLRAAWIVLLVVVLAAAGWAVWLLVGTNQLARNSANHARAGFEASCLSATGEVDPGTGQSVLGLLSFPQQGVADWPIMGGVSDQDLTAGVGWYPATAGPGEIGNMVLTGYRVTNGQPFANLLDLEVGDRVVITTCTHVHTYVIEVAPRDLTVQADDLWVLDAVPGDPGRLPTGRMITLITSQDLLPTDDRSVGFGQLESSRPK